MLNLARALFTMTLVWTALVLPIAIALAVCIIVVRALTGAACDAG